MATFTVRSRTLSAIASTSVTALTREAAIYATVATGSTGGAEVQVLSAE
jgi:hypothetical protein